MGNIVAIVGRPNVGKSTLFNRLVGHRTAIVDDYSGVTRDRHYGISEWGGREFSVIDTGGFVDGSDDIFESAINSQVKIAVEEADVLVFMVDVADGITSLDRSVANLLRRSKKPVLVVVNKVDNNDRIPAASEFYGLGFDQLHNISSASGSGTGDLLDEIIKSLPPLPEGAEEKEEEVLPKIAIVGRPNVGK
jgi:GTPase